MKTKRQLEIKEKKIREALAKEEREERKIEFKKRYLFLIGFIFLVIYYFTHLYLEDKYYHNYNDSNITEKYNQLMENFNNLSRYHLQYKTSIVRGSVDADVFYIKDKLYLERYSEDDETEMQIYIPGREKMTLSIEEGNKECNIFSEENTNFAKEDYPCTFNISLPSHNNSLPINLYLNLNQSLSSTGKLYLIEKNLGGNKIFCFDKKIDVPFISPSFLFGLGKYLPKTIKFLQRIPSRIESSDYKCFTDRGVLVQTIKNEKFVSIEYNFTNEFLNELPLYHDFQKFVNISLENRSTYYKISNEGITTYFKDFNNYVTMGSFDNQEYFTSGCLNGTSLDINGSCNFDISYSQEWANNAFYPLVYVGSKTIANQTADCFKYFTAEVKISGAKEFCIIAGGYTVSESFIWENKTVGYEVTSILESSKKEFDREMEKAVYLSSLN